MPAKQSKTQEASEKQVPKKSLWEKAMTRGEAVSMEKDEILDVLFWFRQIVSVALGIAAGISQQTGAPVIIIYVALMFAANYYYQTLFLDVDPEDFNPNELLMEGLGNSIGLFLLFWILLYTFI